MFANVAVGANNSSFENMRKRPYSGSVANRNAFTQSVGMYKVIGTFQNRLQTSNAIMTQITRIERCGEGAKKEPISNWHRHFFDFFYLDMFELFTEWVGYSILRCNSIGFTSAIT
jgi:hypothetical protein